MKRAIFPGSFDPVTLGHIDLVRRAARVFDEVVVAVARNARKIPRFLLDERVALFEAALAEAGGVGRVRVVPCEGLVAALAKELGACALIKGVRDGGDFSYEAQIAEVNRGLSGVETLLLVADPAKAHISSGVALHLYDMGAPTEAYLPRVVRNALEAQKKR